MFYLLYNDVGRFDEVERILSGHRWTETAGRFFGPDNQYPRHIEKIHFLREDGMVMIDIDPFRPYYPIPPTEVPRVFTDLFETLQPHGLIDGRGSPLSLLDLIGAPIRT